MSEKAQLTVIRTEEGDDVEYKYELSGDLGVMLKGIILFLEAVEQEREKKENA